MCRLQIFNLLYISNNIKICLTWSPTRDEHKQPTPKLIQTAKHIPVDSSNLPVVWTASCLDPKKRAWHQCIQQSCKACCGMQHKCQRNKKNLQWISIPTWVIPLPRMPVTTRNIPFLVGNPNLNLHLPLAPWEGGQWIWIHGGVPILLVISRYIRYFASQFCDHPYNSYVHIRIISMSIFISTSTSLYPYLISSIYL